MPIAGADLRNEDIAGENFDDGIVDSGYPFPRQSRNTRLEAERLSKGDGRSRCSEAASTAQLWDLTIQDALSDCMRVAMAVTSAWGWKGFAR